MGGGWAFHSCSGWVGPRALPGSIAQRFSHKKFGQVDQKKRKYKVVVLDMSGELGVVCNYFNLVFYLFSTVTYNICVFFLTYL